MFRGKRVDNGEWVYGSLFVENARCEIIRGTCNGVGIEGVEVDPKTVGQYTGLTDKNGKKIFEGDILKNEYDDVEVVEYFHNRFVPFAPPFAFDGWCENEIEIIGNVTDNPELLKGGDENA